jgi:hypothetical protein
MTASPIIVVPLFGLCNRMRAMDSAMALGDEWNRPVEVMWQNDQDLGAFFRDLFEPIPSMMIHDRPDAIARALSRWGRFRSMVRIWESLSGGRYYHYDENERLKADIRITPERLRHVPLRIASIGRFFDERPRYARFRPVHAVQERVEAITDRFGPRTVGVHVRRGDNARSMAISTDARFIEHMQREIDADPATTFYLASDSVAVKQLMIDRFGARVITDQLPADRRSVEGMREAVAELFALARTRKILGSHWSSFSHTAAHIGGIKEVEVR